MRNHTRYITVYLFLLLLAAIGPAAAQTAAADTLPSKGGAMVVAVPKGFNRAVTVLDGRYSGISGQVDKQAINCLRRLEKRELALRKRI